MENEIDAPPSYEDVIEEEGRVKKTEKLRLYSKLSFTVINALFSGLIIFGLLLIRFSHVIPVHMRNVTLYCNDPIYNVTPIPKQDNSYAVFMVFFMLTIISTVGIIRFKFSNVTYDILTKKIVLEIWSFTTHLFFLFVAIEIIQSATGIPCPYYFANEELKSYYCGPRDETYNMPRTLKLLDESYRTSFPSYRAAVYSFCLTFLYFYVDHYDILIGLHATQQCVIVMLGTYTSHLLLGYVEKGEHHKFDVVVAIIIGTLHALVAIRNTFGSVVYKRNHISLVAFNKIYTANLNTGSNLYELQTLRQNPNNTISSNNNNQSRNNSRTPSQICTNSGQLRSLIRNIPENVNTTSEQVVPNITLDE